MRIIILFDLPVKSKSERHAATKFRNFLLKDGYQMLQWSVYTRLCNGMGSVNTHKRRLKQELPAKGSVRMILMTEKQYEEIEILLGTAHFDETDTYKDEFNYF